MWIGLFRYRRIPGPTSGMPATCRKVLMAHRPNLRDAGALAAIFDGARVACGERTRATETA